MKAQKSLIDLTFKRHFTKAGSNPYAQINWLERISQIRYAEGGASEEIKIIAPENWSQIAVDIMAQKYAFKGESHGGLPERDVRQIIDRLVHCWSFWGDQIGLFSKNEQKKVFEDELKYMLAHQMASPNSPQWFNTGLGTSYGLNGEETGHFAFDEDKFKCLEVDSRSRPQAHACFIQSVEDDLLGPNGITELWKKETRLFKYGSGSGTNYSKIRAKDEPLSSGGSSSGLMSWLEVSDKVAGAIKSGGTTRRAAKMVCLDLDHPEIEKFISWKVREEEKVASLVVGHDLIKNKINDLFKSHPNIYSKYSAQKLEINELNSYWEGEAYGSVSGQNSNNSVRIPNTFFSLLNLDGDWELSSRVTGKVLKTLKARSLWKQIAECAWSCADPGVQYSTTINEWHTCPQGGEIRASNPCSEYMFLDDTACNLASLNLVKFYENGSWNNEAFEHACRLWVSVLDISVSMASYPSKTIAQKSFEYRTLGLGMANLGGLLLRMGQAYDSEEARSFAGSLAAMLGGSAYHQSALLAQKLGAFAKFKENKKDMLRVLSHHEQSCYENAQFEGLETTPYKMSMSSDSKDLWIRARDLWRETIELAKKSGMRNAQVSAIAPTGTIGLLMDCDTMGIEPEFSFSKIKTLAGGGQFDLTNQSLGIGLKKLCYSDEESQEIIATILEGRDLSQSCLKKEHYGVFQSASGEGDFSVSAQGHLKMMACIQPFISGAISKTINLNASATIEDIEEIYLQGHGLGLKAVAIYREGSKLSQPLISKQSLKENLSFKCPHCGFATMVPAGTCYQCENCGESTSC